MKRVAPDTIFVHLIYAGLAIAFCSPFFAQPAGLGIIDWDQHFFYYAQVIKNVVEYGQAPFWSPWYCGGNVLWQNPQTPLLSPVFPLTSVMGLALAMKVNILLHYWLGFIGMHLLLTRIVGLSSVPIVVFLASIFVLDGAHAMHLAVGHSVFLPSFYLPLMLYLFLRAVQTSAIRPALYAGGIFAITIYNGGLHLVPMAVLAIGVLAMGLSVSRRSWRPILLALIVGVFGVAYAAPKLVPVSLFVTSDRFWDSRDESNHRDVLTPRLMWQAYADPAQVVGTGFDDGVQRHGWLEFGNYIGTLATLLIACSVVWLLVSPARALAPNGVEGTLGTPFAFSALVFLALTAGEFAALAPASLLRHLPLFSSFRLPSRYTIAFVLFGVMAAAVAIRAVVDRIAWTAARQLAVAMICVTAVLQLAVVNRAHFRNTFSLPPLDAGFRVRGGTGTLDRTTFVNPYTSNAPMLHALMNDQAVLWCYEGLQLKRGADGDRALVWSTGPVTVTSIAFTPNRVDFTAFGGAQPARVFLNQNYAEGWSSTAGPVRLDPQAGGRMYVEIAPGQTGRFSFTFVPPGLWAGIGVLVIALGASMGLWRRQVAV